MSLVTSTMPANGAGRSVSEFAPTQNGSKRADPNQNRSKRIVDPAGHQIKLRRPSDRPLRRPKLPSKLAFVPPSRVSCTATSFEFRWPDPFHWPGLVPTKPLFTSQVGSTPCMYRKFDLGVWREVNKAKPRPHRFHDVLHRSLEPLSPAS
uniref:Uncharacterized protein n=1 Tax=Setaria viridis TaxID=4556 RepID=A0A4U6VBU6_SETVI|nr:hypothetical protein SEVIR_3G108500v2 [Setaria viridis]